MDCYFVRMRDRAEHPIGCGELVKCEGVCHAYKDQYGNYLFIYTSNNNDALKVQDEIMKLLRKNYIKESSKSETLDRFTISSVTPLVEIAE